MKKLLFVFLLTSCIASFAQKNTPISFKNGIENPSMLSTHHFGIFSSRIKQNFKLIVPSTTSIRLSTESGNTFHPYVEAFLPKDPSIRADFATKIWYNRHFDFIDQNTTPANYMNMHIDAVIKGFHLDISVPLNNTHELAFSLRSYLITKGKYPFSFITSDESIEWFHSNIAGGEDPYGRRYYGLNQVHFKYTDRNAKVLELKNGDFLLGGLSVSHYYYPETTLSRNKNLYFNVGSHLGINTSSYNASLDVGISANMVKKRTLKNGNQFHFGLGGSILRKNIVNFKENIDLGNNKYLASLEAEVEFTKLTKKKNYHSFGLHYQLQTRYNKLKEADYFHLKGKWREIHAGWHHGFTTLYEGLSAWSFVYTYGTPNYKLTFYLKEDFLVNNAPDAQTGISISLPFL